MTREELKRAALLRIPSHRRAEGEAVADRLLQPFKDRDETVDDGKRMIAVPNRETGHPDYRQIETGPRKVAPYNFTVRMVAWLHRELRRELRLP